MLSWIHGVPDRALFLSAVTVGELHAGAELQRKQDSEKIEAWIDQLASAYEVIPMDALMFREWARLMAGKSDHLLEDAKTVERKHVFHQFHLRPILKLLDLQPPIWEDRSNLKTPAHTLNVTAELSGQTGTGTLRKQGIYGDHDTYPLA